DTYLGTSSRGQFSSGFRLNAAMAIVFIRAQLQLAYERFGHVQIMDPHVGEHSAILRKEGRERLNRPLKRSSVFDTNSFKTANAAIHNQLTYGPDRRNPAPDHVDGEQAPRGDRCLPHSEAARLVERQWFLTKNVHPRPQQMDNGFLVQCVR